MYWYKKFGKKDEVSRLLDEAASSCRSDQLNKSKVWKADTLRRIADELRDAGRQEEAFEFYKHWETHSEWHNDGCFEADVCHVASAYIDLNRTEEAVRLFNAYISILKQDIDCGGFVSSRLLDCAELFQKAGKMDEALGLLKESESRYRRYSINHSIYLFKAASENKDEIDFSKISDLYRQCGQLDEVDRLAKEKALCEETWKEAYSLKLKADVLKKKGQFDEAVEFYKKCEVHLREKNVYWIKEEYLSEIKRSYRDMKKPEEVDRLVKELASVKKK